MINIPWNRFADDDSLEELWNVKNDTLETHSKINENGKEKGNGKINGTPFAGDDSII